jgi:hypothetical protein
VKKGTVISIIVLFVSLTIIAQVSIGRSPCSTTGASTSAQVVLSGASTHAHQDSIYWHQSLRCIWVGGELVCFWEWVDDMEQHPFEGDPQIGP